MPNPTPAAQVADLSELFGITPETHRHLFNNVCWCGSDIFNVMVAGDYDVAYCDECGGRWDDVSINTFIGPDPLGPDADGVWLAAVLAYMDTTPFMAKIIGGCNARIAEVSIGDESYMCNSQESYTAALLQACLAARVPEVCKILEATHE